MESALPDVQELGAELVATARYLPAGGPHDIRRPEVYVSLKVRERGILSASKKQLATPMAMALTAKRV